MRNNDSKKFLNEKSFITQRSLSQISSSNFIPFNYRDEVSNIERVQDKMLPNSDFHDIMHEMSYLNEYDPFNIPNFQKLFTQKMPLKTLKEKEYILVNSKQYFRILKRREKRKVLMELIRIDPYDKEKKYHHESRHKHAMNRERGKGGRFLSKKPSQDHNTNNSNNNNSNCK